jgi:hypothetical protein
MKNLVIAGLLLLVFFPAFSQKRQIQQLPAAEVKSDQGMLPDRVREAFIKNFGEGHLPFAWVTDVSNINTERLQSENLDFERYTLSTRTNGGSTLDAYYSADGTLLSSRENLKNFRLDRPILVSLQSTQYKDWSINKTFHVIKSSFKGIEKERYGIVMKKGKEKRTLLLDPNGMLLADIRGELSEANWEDQL